MKHIYLLLVLSIHLLSLSVSCKLNQISSLNKLINSKRSDHPPHSEQWTDENISSLSPSFIIPQKGSMKADRIHSLPGQPKANFDQYAGYVTVDAKARRELFYYFVESPRHSATKPLVLWLNGGPGCSSLGYGAMGELGPFRVNRDRKTLQRNNYAWNDVANVLFLESPAGVGFSYSSRSSDYTTSGDKRTTTDSYTFLVNWLERFPQFKAREFFITGESYAGHFVPQLASLVLSENKKTNRTIINLRGIAIGNAWIDDSTGIRGMYDYFHEHALNSDETNAGINKHCDFDSAKWSDKFYKYLGIPGCEIGYVDLFNIYAPFCDEDTQESGSFGYVKKFDPCTDEYVATYLNLPEVQEALHARKTTWESCRAQSQWTDSPNTILPIINQPSEKGISVWIFSGDIDGRVPITSTRYSIKKLNLSVETAWRPWYNKKEVGGYVECYKGVVLATVRGAGHEVPSYQPERVLVMISAFLRGELPPPFIQ